MQRVQKSPEAKSDLYQIWEFIAQDNPNAADRLLSKIMDKLQFIAEFPGAGASRGELSPGLRGSRVGNYLLFYRTTDDGIELVRALHGARDVRRVFRGEA